MRKGVLNYENLCLKILRAARLLSNIVFVNFLLALLSLTSHLGQWDMLST